MTKRNISCLAVFMRWVLFDIKGSSLHHIRLSICLREHEVLVYLAVGYDGLKAAHSLGPADAQHHVSVRVLKGVL